MSDYTDKKAAMSDYTDKKAAFDEQNLLLGMPTYEELHDLYDVTRTVSIRYGLIAWDVSRERWTGHAHFHVDGQSHHCVGKGNSLHEAARHLKLEVQEITRWQGIRNAK